MEQILFKWTGVDGIDPNSRGININAREFAVLEKFFGESVTETYGLNPNYEASVFLKQSYHDLFEAAYAGLMAQTHLKELYGKITYTWNYDTGEYVTDMSGVIAALQSALQTDPEQGRELLSEFARTMRGLGHDRVSCLPCREIFIQMDPSLGWVIDTGGLSVIDGPHQGPWSYSNHVFGTVNSEAITDARNEGDGAIFGLHGDDVIYGTDRNENIYNDDGDAVVIGGGGNDGIWAGAGNDMLEGRVVMVKIVLNDEIKNQSVSALEEVNTYFFGVAEFFS